MAICRVLIPLWLLLITIIGIIILITSYFIILLGLDEFPLFRETAWYRESDRDMGDKREMCTAVLWSQANVVKMHGLPENVFLLCLKMKTAIASSAGRARTLSVKCVSKRLTVWRSGCSINGCYYFYIHTALNLTSQMTFWLVIFHSNFMK